MGFMYLWCQVFLITSLMTVPLLTEHHPRRNHQHSLLSHAERTHDNEMEDAEKDFPQDNDIEDDEKLALLHSQRVSELGSCEVPKLQVIHVSDHYPGRYYLPHCTMLHRCGKHAGCCGTDRLKCVAAHKEKVILHFFSVRVLGHGIPAERKIEKLAFTNHTKCACVPIEHSARHDL